MPPASSRGNGRLSTTPAAASTSASASVSSSSSPSAVANLSASASTSARKPSTSSSSISTFSSRPGFLSRLSLPLTLPLRGRNRNVTDFHVRCDEPHKKYTAGDHVRGAAVLTVVKPIRITHLVVTLHGFVRVFKDSAAVAKAQGSPTLPQGGSSSRPQYHGNGFASLFQDEQVLSGEGRLEPSKYEFNFDLVFPERGLPSSIDFERGTISYMITATLTRPTTITPTTTCERKVMLAERLDVGHLPRPRPRTIFLEPISKRTRRKKSTMTLDKGSAAAPEPSDLASGPESLEQAAAAASTEDSVRDTSPPDIRNNAPSDVQSEVSGESGRSISTAMSRTEFVQLSQVGTATYTSAHQQAVDDKTITATVELLKGGCLPGDIISVRVTVQHVKLIKSMTGVIVTLFRQGKVDCAPPASLFNGMMTKEDARRLQKDDVYPKSRTGLGGLSLSSAGSTSIFRKDLDQTTAPLIIDPATLRASITVQVKLPEDSFPTIKGIPGDMISFKYQAEVIVDLGGRLSGQLLQSGQSSRFGSLSTGNAEQNMSMLSPRRGINMVDTSQLKRQKGVISVSMESVVGTVDTSIIRKPLMPTLSTRSINVAETEDDDVIRPDIPYRDDNRQISPSNNGVATQGYFMPQPNGQSYYASSPPPHPYFLEPPMHELLQSDSHSRGPAPMYIAPPQLPNQNNMSDKDRIRQAETRLLPSQPSAGPSHAVGALAPDEDDIYDAQETPRAADAEASAAETSSNAEASAPTEDEITALSSVTRSPTEDKQEMERRRLIQEASAPPEFPEDMDRGEEDGTAPRLDDLTSEAEPSAPVLDEDDGFAAYGAHAGPSGSGSGSRGPGHGNVEQLPAYER